MRSCCLMEMLFWFVFEIIENNNSGHDAFNVISFWIIAAIPVHLS